MSVGLMSEQKSRPAYVRFERVAVENEAASLAAGHYVGRDVDMAHLTQPGTRDVFKIEVAQWFDNLKGQVARQRIPQEWLDNYRKAYRAWKEGQEAPPTGTPIKGWSVISPSQERLLLDIHVLTVEDLANLNDEGIKRIGMGAVDLRLKARAWLQQAQDKGPLVMQISALTKENGNQAGQIATLTRQVNELMAMVRQQQTAPASEVPHVESDRIAVDDILDPVPGQDETPAPRKRGRPRKDASPAANDDDAEPKSNYAGNQSETEESHIL